MALWEYSESSASYLFGDALGDPDADQILATLKANPEGLTRTQITRDVFQGNRSANQIDRALGSLYKHGHVGRVVHRGREGRPSEIWTAKKKDSKVRKVRTDAEQD